MPSLTKDELQRYSRQTVLPELGEDGQKRLKSASILVVGAGGLGCPALMYLAAAGAGHIGIIDDDKVDVTNLQRQVLFKTQDSGLLKAETAARHLRELNPNTTVTALPKRLDLENVLGVFSDYSIIIDGTDNFSAKYLINDAAVKLELPVVYGSISGFEGYVSVFWAKKGEAQPCYRCLYPYPPEGFVPNCQEAGVIGALPGIIGSIQALEAIKLAVAHPRLQPLLRKLLVVDAATMTSKTLSIARNPDCPVCGDKPSLTELTQYDTSCPSQNFEISAEELQTKTDVHIVDIREEKEWQSGIIPGAELIPLSKIQRGHPINTSEDKLCVLYCRSGIRTLTALEILKERGCKNVKHLRGGILAWKGPTVIP